ncbi:CARDB domain-containing protein [Haloferax sp. DFSO60]|uniref:CARDB domain-containing protein n=1 Tax=Haloferax sp. DFSO60 TaxID=3388652 RepID=UPI00397BF52D
MATDPLIIGALGGFLANFGAQVAWRLFQKPRLMFTHNAPTEFVTGEKYKKIEYRVQVKNHGNSAAKNCRAFLYMSGITDDTKYVIKTNPHWVETGRPSTTKINPGDTVSFPVYRYYLSDTSSNQIPASIRPRYRFPTEDGWEENIEMVHEYHLDDGEVQNMSFSEDITAATFDEIHWYKQQISVTSENGKKISGDFEEVPTQIMSGLVWEKIEVEGDVIMTSQSPI